MAVALTMRGNENDQLGNPKSDGKSPKLVEALKAVCRCFTSCLPILECFSRVDKSACTGCRKPFGFTRKTHNCYNCGLACTSRKVLNPAAKPVEPHRVCDSCVTKLEAVEEADTASANEVLNEEVSKLQNQTRSSKQKSDMEIQKLWENTKEATLLAAEESSKCRAMKEICVSMLEQMKEMARSRAEDFLKEFESSSVPSNLIFEPKTASSTLASNLPELRIEENNEAAKVDQSQDGGNVLQESNIYSVPNSEAAMPPLSSESSRSLHSSRFAIDVFERGVYVTVVVNSDGSKVFNRIRFSKRLFHQHQVDEWWNKNKDKVFRKYSPQATNPEGSGSSSAPAPAEENIEAAPSQY